MADRRKDSKNRVLKEGEYQRSNGTYEYKWRDRRGKRHSIYAKTLDELRQKENDVLRDLLDGVRTDKNSLTINDLYTQWVQLKKGLKHNTFQNYKYSYTQYVQSEFGRSLVIDLKRTDVRAFYNYLSDTQHLRPNTIDSIHTVLHQVLEIGVEDEYLRYNPADNALKEIKKAHNHETQKRKALTIPEQNLLEYYLTHIPQYRRWYPLLTVMLYTGMRLGETTGLRWEDIDLEEGEINVNHTLVYYRKQDVGGCSFAINTPKSIAGTRIIPMLPIVREAFIQERQYQNELNIKCKVTIDGYTNFIFINRFGSAQHQGTVNKALKRIIRDCNYYVLDKETKDSVLLPNFSSHTLRHTFTTRLCEAGVNIKVIQDILGHADAETTLQIYADVTKDLKKREINQLDEFLNTFKNFKLTTDIRPTYD